MRTNEQGRFAFRTIRPGHYPDEGEPVEQHIHFEVTPIGRASVQTRLGFADDPFWKGKQIPGWVAEVSKGENGEALCRFEIQVRDSR